jgi:nitrite reductase/ring-hydroxylating ferredoxin subunit/DMSO/TMAO reductase YedYZ heme-binding membrane subunit
VYDAVVAGGVSVFVMVFVAASVLLSPEGQRPSGPIVIIRALGVCAIVMLHIALAIGPACRLDRRLLPLLYNRRHLGVMMFLVALGHGLVSTVWYHGFGNINPGLSLLSSNTRLDSLREFPFEVLGIAALLWLGLMAATSHDFWLKNLSPRVWKNLHMGVYVAYVLLIGHVALGVMQSERSPVIPVLLGLGVTSLTCLHLAAARREVVRDRVRRGPAADGSTASSEGGSAWVDVAAVDDLPPDRAVTVCLNRGQGDGRSERVAVYRHGDAVSAIGNVCRHQGGPLGEGRVIDGCVTCPWHGYQYRPGDGCAPPPFDDRVPTYRVRITRGRVEIEDRPLPPGTAVPPAMVGSGLPQEEREST